MPLTISDLMSKMPGAFLPEKAVGLDAVIQFKFTGAEVWKLVCNHQGWQMRGCPRRCAFAEDDPDCRLGRLHQNVHWRTGWYASLYARQA